MNNTTTSTDPALTWDTFRHFLDTLHYLFYIKAYTESEILTHISSYNFSHYQKEALLTFIFTYEFGATAPDNMSEFTLPSTFYSYFLSLHTEKATD